MCLMPEPMLSGGHSFKTIWRIQRGKWLSNYSHLFQMTDRSSLMLMSFKHLSPIYFLCGLDRLYHWILPIKWYRFGYPYSPHGNLLFSPITQHCPCGHRCLFSLWLWHVDIIGSCRKEDTAVEVQKCASNPGHHCSWQVSSKPLFLFHICNISFNYIGSVSDISGKWHMHWKQTDFF